MIGTWQEAKEIYETTLARWTDDWYTPKSHMPEGWQFLGEGGSRMAFLAPSGVVYKVCFNYETDWPCYNDQEKKNFDFIEQSGRLLDGWSVPKSHLHSFNAWVYRYNRGRTEKEMGRVAVLAVEYVEGMPIEYHDDERRKEMIKGMDAVGLFDAAKGNTLLTAEGWVIVDAAEGYLSPYDRDEEIKARGRYVAA